MHFSTEALLLPSAWSNGAGEEPHAAPSISRSGMTCSSRSSSFSVKGGPQNDEEAPPVPEMPGQGQVGDATLWLLPNSEAWSSRKTKKLDFKGWSLLNSWYRAWCRKVKGELELAWSGLGRNLKVLHFCH